MSEFRSETTFQTPNPTFKRNIFMATAINVPRHIFTIP
ncbi:hypothetical protein D3OALGB2SA_1449 [Olavius algarvensis associated proteobacterium Delta 3]|nr:hypothetical protein D3OALGB2SA_1449 [Olavius algarvensis associated proteobacterium Delta 3]